MSDELNTKQVFERPTVSSRPVLVATFGAIALMFGTIGLFSAIYDAAVPIKTLPAPEVFAEPRVDTQQAELLQRLLAEQRKKLETWGWANDRHTMVQIPIERAMRLVAQKGRDAYAPLLPGQPSPSSPSAGAESMVTPAMRGGLDRRTSAPRSTGAAQPRHSPNPAPPTTKGADAGDSNPSAAPARSEP